MIELLKNFWNASKDNPTAFKYEMIQQPFIVAGSLLTGINVMVNPTLVAFIGFSCFAVGSICGLISEYKRNSMSILVGIFHTFLNLITLAVMAYSLI